MNRRTALKNIGVTLTLPFLESLHGRRAMAEAAAPPKRIAFIYTPNGYNQSSFVPVRTGPVWDLPEALTPLASVRDEITMVTGLDRQFVGGTGVHAQCGSCWLTSSPPQETLDGGFPTNITLDQMIARQIGADTALPSLELSCNDFTDNKETRYFECISWYGPGFAANTEKNPRNVFRRLFGGGAGNPLTASILDLVQSDARMLRKRLAHDDRHKLDEYLDSVRSTEKRIQIAEKAAGRDLRPPIPEPAGIPARRDQYLRLMGDLMVLAFRMDLTRVATLVVDPERWDSPRMFHGVFDTPQNHHVLTHTKGGEAKRKITEIDRFHVDFYRYVVERLRAIPEGPGTLLDNSLVVMGSGISDGDRHVYQDLQVLMAGKAGGMIRPGSHFHYAGDRPLADLWLTLLGKYGVDAPRFADSTAPLSQLS